MLSAAGEALQTLPARVPAFWICTPPISRAASFSPSKQGGRSARMRSVQVTPAPMRKWVGVMSIRRSADDGGDIEQILIGRPLDPRRIIVGAAGDHRDRPLAQHRQRVAQLAGAVIASHGQGSHTGSLLFRHGRRKRESRGSANTLVALDSRFRGNDGGEIEFASSRTPIALPP